MEGQNSPVKLGKKIAVPANVLKQAKLCCKLLVLVPINTTPKKTVTPTDPAKFDFSATPFFTYSRNSAKMLTRPLKVVETFRIHQNVRSDHIYIGAMKKHIR